MEKVLKNKCSLEEEYAFEHKARIKAEDYISELWEMHAELEKEVLRLQSIIIKEKHLEKEKPLVREDKELKIRMERIYQGKNKVEKNMSKIIKKVFK